MNAAPLRIAERGHPCEQQPDCLKRRKSPGPARHRAQHAVLGAAVAVVGVEGVAHETAVARLIGQMPRKGANLALEAADRGAEQGHGGRDASVRHRQPGGEVIGPVQYEVGPCEQAAGIVAGYPQVADRHRQRIVETGEPLPRRHRLAVAHIARAEEGLALEIGKLHHPIVDQRQPADPGPRQILQRRAADAAQPDQHHLPFGQRRLPRAADLGDDDVAREAIETGGRQAHA